MNIIFLGANNPETERMMEAVPQHNYIGFLDNNPKLKGSYHCGMPIIRDMKNISLFILDDVYFVNLITRDTLTRFEVTNQILKQGGKFANFIHPTSKDSFYGVTGNYIQERVTMQAGVCMGSHNSIHFGSLIAHETVIEDYAIISFGVNISGRVTIKTGAYIGAGSTILPDITIGEWATVGAGAVVTQDVQDGVVVASPSARKI